MLHSTSVLQMELAIFIIISFSFPCSTWFLHPYLYYLLYYYIYFVEPLQSINYVYCLTQHKQRLSVKHFSKSNFAVSIFHVSDHVCTPNALNLSMLRLLSSKAQGCNFFWKPSKPCHVGIHWIALDDYSQMSTHMPGFQSFFSFFASFCIGKISHQQHKGYTHLCSNCAISRAN